MTINIAINGYGRIGRDLHRQLIGHPEIHVKAINSRADAKSHALLLKYDSLYGTLSADVKAEVDGEKSALLVNGKRTEVYQITDPEKLPWGELNIDVVIESTGKFTKKADANKHIQAGAKKVLITAPCKDKEVATIVMGVNQEKYNPATDTVVSNASCTTNCLAPIMKILCDTYGVEQAFVSTIHSLTHTQNLLDNSHKDPRRARATMSSIIPTTTGAMEAIGQVIPELNGKIDGLAFRVPTMTVSLIDAAVKLKKNVTADELNERFKKASQENPRVFGVSAEPLVAIDFKGDTRSTIVDLELTKVLPDGFVKVVSWYDNEWGYVARVVDLIGWITK